MANKLSAQASAQEREENAEEQGGRERENGEESMDAEEGNASFCSLHSSRKKTDEGKVRRRAKRSFRRRDEEEIREVIAAV
jgi:hypothetical protein